MVSAVVRCPVCFCFWSCASSRRVRYIVGREEFRESERNEVDVIGLLSVVGKLASSASERESL